MVHGAYDANLVLLSILIATVASYTALDLAGRITAAEGIARYAWLITAAAVMGGGIFSMHFVAMLAFSLPMPIAYDLGLTLLSLVLAILVTGAGFIVVNRYGTGASSVLSGGVFMGLGIVAMHYTGMAAMRMAADLSYDRLWVAISVFIAIGAASTALWLAFRNTGIGLKIAAAIAMGAAISGMHYSAMRAAIFTAQSHVAEVHGAIQLDQTKLAFAIAITTFAILSFALVASYVDRGFAVLAEREAAALRVSEERFRALYSKTPLPLVSLDARALVEHASNAWLDMFGYEREHVLGSPLDRFLSRESAAKLRRSDWPALLEKGEFRDIEYRAVTSSGEMLDVLLSLKVERDPGGDVSRIVGGMIDVTARKRAERALLHSQKLEAIGQLTGGVAHDFNNLLAIVLGNLELLRKRVSDEPRVKSLIENAIQGVNRGTALTQRMLAFARRQELKPQKVDIPELVAGMVELLKRSLGPIVQIRTEIAPGLPRALVDANQLELALMNLSLNARDAMPAGGTLTIAADEHKGELDGETSTPTGRYVRLRVIDTGTGMDEKTLTRAVEPFFTTKGTGKGTGLGLSMVQGVVAQSGGRLELKSRSGEGTTIILWLPAVDDTEAPQPVESETLFHTNETIAGPFTVMVVDDDPLVLTATAAMLEDLGHTPVGAKSGEAALELLRSGHKIDVLITDQAMPGMTGTELVAKVKAQWPDLPVIVATGYAELDNSVRGLPRLGKPFRQDALAAAIADHARSS
jgi:PAS domain S-box-containing protein